MTASNPSASQGPIYTVQKIRSGHIKHRGGDMSSSSGTVYRPGSFMAFFRHGQERLRGDISGLDPDSENRDLRLGNEPTDRIGARSQISTSTTERKVCQRKKKSINSHAKDRKGKGEGGNGEIKIYMQIWDGLDGECGYISKRNAWQIRWNTVCLSRR